MGLLVAVLMCVYLGICVHGPKCVHMLDEFVNSEDATREYKCIRDGCACIC